MKRLFKQRGPFNAAVDILECGNTHFLQPAIILNSLYRILIFIEISLTLLIFNTHHWVLVERNIDEIPCHYFVRMIMMRRHHESFVIGITLILSLSCDWFYAVGLLGYELYCCVQVHFRSPAEQLHRDKISQNQSVPLNMLDTLLEPYWLFWNADMVENRLATCMWRKLSTVQYLVI